MRRASLLPLDAVATRLAQLWRRSTGAAEPSGPPSANWTDALAIASALQTAPVQQPFSLREALDLGRRMVTHRLAAGTDLRMAASVDDQDPAALLIVVQGEAQEAVQLHGQHTALGSVGLGAILCMQTLGDQNVASATLVRARSDMTVATLSCAALQAISMQAPAAANKLLLELLRQFSERMRNAQSVVAMQVDMIAALTGTLTGKVPQPSVQGYLHAHELALENGG
jgi:CRP-like cAMP-binding protein